MADSELELEFTDYRYGDGVYRHIFDEEKGEDKRFIRHKLGCMSDDGAEWLIKFCRAVCDVADERGHR